MLGREVKKMFRISKSLYGQSLETFYVSTEDYKKTGIHLAILPPHKLKKFSEYTLGNPEDISKIVTVFKKNKTVKSLYCSMCTLLEPDNYFVFDKAGQLKQGENLARKLHHSFDLNGIRFNLTATTPQYFYNHLLLSTDSHIVTYFTLLDKQYFLAVSSFIQEVSRDISDIKGVFNGTFGSDTWHLHLHITDQKFAIIESLKKDLSNQKNPPESGIYQRGFVFGRYFISKDPERVYTLVSSYAGQLFSLNRNKMFMGAIFTFHKGYHIVFLLLGKKASNIQLKNGKTVFFILPGFIANFQNLTAQEITTSDIDEAFLRFQRIKAYEPILKLKPITVPLNVLWEHLFRQKDIPMEVIQGLFTRNRDCSVIENLGKRLDIFNDSLGCSHQGPKCSDTARARYKFLLTLILLCSYLKFGTKFYQYLLNNDNFYIQAVYAELAYMMKTFGVRKIDSMFLRGFVAQSIVRRTFQDLLLISSSNPASREVLIPGTPKMDFWLNYKFRRIGDPSAMGYIVPASLKQAQESRFIVKINAKYHQREQYNEFAHEIAVGLQINSLRKNIPNFLLTFGGFECHGDPNYQKLCTPFPGNPMMNYMLLELVDSKFTVDKWFSSQLQSTLSDRKLVRFFFVMVGQIMASLAYAQETQQFTHYDLHAGNIMFYEYQNKEWLKTMKNLFPKISHPQVEFRYKIKGKEYSIPSQFLYIIIDYGFSHISGVKTDIKRPKWFTPDKFRKSPDVYTLIIYLFLLIIQFRSSLLQTKWIGDFYRAFFNSYGSLFTKSYSEIVRILIDVKSREKKPDVRESLIKTLGNLRKDRQYYLYLPIQMEDIDSSFSSPLRVLERLVNLFKGKFTSNIVYKWGEYKDPGLDTGKDRVKLEQSVKIKKLRTEK